MKIAIGTSTLFLSRGGTERAAVNLAHEMLKRGHEPFFISYPYQKTPVYDLDKRIEVHFYPEKFYRGKNDDIASVRALLVNCCADVFISMQSHWMHMLWALGCLGTGIPFICSERSDPRYSESVTWSRPGRHAVLASADYIHELSAAHLETVPAQWRDKVRIIPNAAPEARLKANPGNDGMPVILFLARFVESKRCILLLEAFRLLAPRYPNWKLHCLGYGMEEPKLRQFVQIHNLQDRVRIERPGGDDGSVFAEYANASIYCLPTHVEGFPNTALEAMAAGLPIVGINDCPAMRDLADRGCALLASDATPEALASVLSALMKNPESREQMGNQSRELCATFYKHENVYDQWEKLLMDAALLKGHTLMDTFKNEPFASMATLSSAARREWLYRNFGDPMPGSLAWLCSRAFNLAGNIKRLFP